MHIRSYEYTHMDTHVYAYTHITIITYLHSSVLFTSPQQDFLNAIFEVTLQWICIRDIDGCYSTHYM